MIIARLLPIVSRKLRFLIHTVLCHLAEMVAPTGTVVALEYRARKSIQSSFPEFRPFLTDLYDCVANYDFLVDGRPVTSLSAREIVSLKLLGRIGTAVHRLAEDVYKGYGWEACGVAASLFELCWQARRLSQSEELASDWLDLAKAPKVKQTIFDALKLEGVKNSAEQAGIEYVLYGKLCDMKHGNPARLTFHHPRDWQEWGTMRMGPDTTPGGLWATCLAVDAAGFLVLGAMERFVSALHPESGKPLLDEINRLTHEHEKIRFKLNQVFKSSRPASDSLV